MSNNQLLHRLMHGNLIAQIAAGIALGVVLFLISPKAAASVALLGGLFVDALRAVAPVLVFVLVASAIANQGAQRDSRLRPIFLLYLFGTFSAALLAVLLSGLFPTTLVLQVNEATLSPPQNILDVLGQLLDKLIDNPVNALVTGNFIGILVWGAALGAGLRHASDTSRTVFSDLADVIIKIVRVVIRFAPVGIFGLVAGSLAVAGLGALGGYARILTVLLSAMLIMALLVNPLLVWLKTRRNPYPTVFSGPQGKRYHGVFHPQLGRQYPG